MEAYVPAECLLRPVTANRDPVRTGTVCSNKCTVKGNVALNSTSSPLENKVYTEYYVIPRKDGLRTKYLLTHLHV